MGHEFTGTVEEVGSAVKNFTKGNQIVSPFTLSWSADNADSMWQLETHG